MREASGTKNHDSEAAKINSTDKKLEADIESAAAHDEPTSSVPDCTRGKPRNRTLSPIGTTEPRHFNP